MPYCFVTFMYSQRVLQSNRTPVHRGTGLIVNLHDVAHIITSTIPPLYFTPEKLPRFAAVAISILLEPIRQYYLNIRQYY